MLDIDRLMMGRNGGILRTPERFLKLFRITVYVHSSRLPLMSLLRKFNHFFAPRNAGLVAGPDVHE